MFLDEITKEDMMLIQEFEEKIINKLDDSTFHLAVTLVEKIIKKAGISMHTNDYENKIVRFKFDDITFHKTMKRGGR